MEENFNLNINVFEFYKSASVKELKEAIAQFRKASEAAHMRMRELQQMVNDFVIKEAEKKLGDIKAGDKVFVVYEYRSWDRTTNRKEVEGHYFHSITIVGKESVYKREGPYINLNRPKKDGSRGMRYISIKAEEIVEIRKAD